MSNPTITGDSSNVNISNADLVVSQDVYCNKVYNSNYVSNESDLDNATATNHHGMTMHVHGTGALYYAHGGQWRKLLTDTSGGSVSGYSDPLHGVAYSGDGGNLSNVFTLSSSTSLTGSEASGIYYPTLHQSGKIQRKDTNLTWEPLTQKLTAGFFVGDGGLLSNVSGGGGGTTPTLQQVTDQGSSITGDITANAFFDSNGIIVSGGGGGGGGSVTIETTPTEVFPSNVLTVNMASGGYKTFTANINQGIDTFTVQNHTAGSQGIVYLRSNTATSITINGKTSGLAGSGVIVGFDDIVLENTNYAIFSFTSDGSNVFTNAVKYPSGVISGIPTFQQITSIDPSTTNRVILQGGMVTGNVASNVEVLSNTLNLDLGGLSYKTFTCDASNDITGINITNDITGTQGIVFINATTDLTVNGKTSGLNGSGINVSFDDMEVSSGEKALLVFTSDGTDRYFNTVKYPSTAPSVATPTSNLDQVVTKGNVTSNTLTVGGLTATANVDAGNSYVSGTVTAGSFVGDGSSLTNLPSTVPSRKFIEVYTNSVQGGITTNYVKIPYSLTRRSSGSNDFTLSSYSVTVKNAGYYLINYSASTYVTSSTSNRTTSKAALHINNNWTAGTSGWMYNRMQTYGHNSCSRTMIFLLNANDVIDIRVIRQSGTDTIGTISHGCGLTIMDL